MVAVLQSTAATRSELAALHQTLASRVAMEIVASDASAFLVEDLPPVAAEPGVQAAIPIFRVFSKLVADGGDARGIAIGVDLEQYRVVRDFNFVSGRMCAEKGEVCLEANVAESLGVAIGDEVRLGARGLPWLLPKTVVGILKPLGIGAVEETASMFLTLADAATLGKAPRKATALQIVLQPETDADSIATKIRAQLPDHLVLTHAASAAHLSQPTEDIINVGLHSAAALAVVAAIFIVINTFQISVAERQRQLALLRIVGATTDQVRVDVPGGVRAGRYRDHRRDCAGCLWEPLFGSRYGGHLWLYERDGRIDSTACHSRRSRLWPLSDTGLCLVSCANCVRRPTAGCAPVCRRTTARRAVAYFVRHWGDVLVGCDADVWLRVYGDFC